MCHASISPLLSGFSLADCTIQALGIGQVPEASASEQLLRQVAFLVANVRKFMRNGRNLQGVARGWRPQSRLKGLACRGCYGS